MTTTDRPLCTLAIAYPEHHIWRAGNVWYATRRKHEDGRDATVFSEHGLFDLARKLDEQMRDPEPAPNLYLLKGDPS